MFENDNPLPAYNHISEWYNLVIVDSLPIEIDILLPMNYSGANHWAVVLHYKNDNTVDIISIHPFVYQEKTGDLEFKQVLYSFKNISADII